MNQPAASGVAPDQQPTDPKSMMREFLELTRMTQGHAWGHRGRRPARSRAPLRSSPSRSLTVFNQLGSTPVLEVQDGDRRVSVASRDTRCNDQSSRGRKRTTSRSRTPTHTRPRPLGQQSPGATGTFTI